MSWGSRADQRAQQQSDWRRRDDQGRQDRKDAARREQERLHAQAERGQKGKKP